MRVMLCPQTPDPLAQLRVVHLRPPGLELVLPARAHRTIGEHLGPSEASRRSGLGSIVTTPLALPLSDGTALTAAFA